MKKEKKEKKESSIIYNIAIAVAVAVAIIVACSKFQQKKLNFMLYMRTHKQRSIGKRNIKNTSK